VSTGTGIMSHFVNLHIVVPEAFILGNGEHHVDISSTISLVCIIEKVSSSWSIVYVHFDSLLRLGEFYYSCCGAKIFTCNSF
jgi:hypothetical protein